MRVGCALATRATLKKRSTRLGSRRGRTVTGRALRRRRLVKQNLLPLHCFHQ